MSDWDWAFEPDDTYDEFLSDYLWDVDFDEEESIESSWIEDSDLAEWKNEVVSKLVEETSLDESYIREIIDNEFEEYFWDDYTVEQVVEMFLEEEK